MTSQIIVFSIVYSTVCSGANQRKHQFSAPLAFVRGIHRWPVNSPHNGPVTRKMFPFADVIIYQSEQQSDFNNDVKCFCPHSSKRSGQSDKTTCQIEIWSYCGQDRLVFEQCQYCYIQSWPCGGRNFRNCEHFRNWLQPQLLFKNVRCSH